MVESQPAVRGLVNPPLASTAFGVVTPQRSGLASGVNTTSRQLGIAAFGAIFSALVGAVGSAILIRPEDFVSTGPPRSGGPPGGQRSEPARKADQS